MREAGFEGVEWVKFGLGEGKVKEEEREMVEELGKVQWGVGFVATKG